MRLDTAEEAAGDNGGMTETPFDTTAGVAEEGLTDEAALPVSLAFSQVGLSESLQRAVAAQGYTMMTPIKAKAIPVVLAGRDVMGAAQTGTGKTAAFSLPLLHKMLRHENASKIGRASCRERV